MKSLKKGRQVPLPLRLTCLAVTLLPLALLDACGGGSGSGTTTIPAQISGTIATGNFVPNATVTATDTHGKTAIPTSDSNRHYSIDTTAPTAPVALVAADTTSQSSNAISVLVNLPVGGQSATANISTMTTSVTASLALDGNPPDWVTPRASTTKSSVVTSANVKYATVSQIKRLQGFI